MKIGQWVHTKYMGKHDCTGFVTDLYPDFRRCKIRVTKCVNYPNMKWLEISYDDAIPDHYEYSPAEIKSLIDLALDTRDKDWFDEISMFLRY